MNLETIIVLLGVFVLIFSFMATIAAFGGDTFSSKGTTFVKRITPRGWLSLSSLVMVLLCGASEAVLTSIEQNTPEIDLKLVQDDSRDGILNGGDNLVVSTAVDIQSISHVSFCEDTGQNCGYGFSFRVPDHFIDQHVTLGDGQPTIFEVDVRQLSSQIDLFHQAAHRAAQEYGVRRMQAVFVNHILCVQIGARDALGGEYFRQYAIDVSRENAAEWTASSRSYHHCRTFPLQFDYSGQQEFAMSGNYINALKATFFRGFELVPGRKYLWEEILLAESLKQDALRFLR